MAKILVFQHVPYEPLGALDPLLRQHRHRIRYVNFARSQTRLPNMKNYTALIVLGGPMNIGEEGKYPHLELEKAAIRKALELEVPILGICLGAQLLASALGARVYPTATPEIGWHSVTPTTEGKSDQLIRHFQESTSVFQWHGHTFDLPQGAIHLASGDDNGCPVQAFRYGSLAYGFQFHLEACASLIERWLNLPAHREDIGADGFDHTVAKIRGETKTCLPVCKDLGLKVFGEFINLLPVVRKLQQMPSR